MPANVWLLNLIVFGVLLESDLGRRPIGWFRVLRPLITTAAIIPLFLTAVPTSGHNLLLQVVGAGLGMLLGLAAHLFISVSFDPARGRKRKAASKPASGRPVSRAGFGYAAFWAVIFAGRLLFIYGTLHWFTVPLGQFFAAHQLSADGLTNSLIFMALAMALTRSALLGIRGREATRRAAAGRPAGALGAVTATRPDETGATTRFSSSS
jgi:hypothetical protein